MNNNITNTGIFLKQSAVSLRSKFSDFTGKGGQTQIPFRTVLLNANAILWSASRALSPGDLSTPAAPNPVDNLEAVAWQPQPGRATGCRSFFEQGKLPHPGCALSARATITAEGSPTPLSNSTSVAPPCFSSAGRGTLSDRAHCCARAYRWPRTATESQTRWAAAPAGGSL
ncbi:hypothetical protein KLAF111653_15395 [Klebsiella africana]|uniref:Uncharacterized protein n=1 Tax=Klebsiella africana TaxID=2489010 RepID=A0A8B6IUD1_9ENTR|nr:hypothetical protein SB5857_03354 [Klebsiella africana]